MVRSIDLALLRTFVTVAEMESFTGAARVLGLSQSAVSLQVRRLEEGVGATLLRRTKREVGLTPPGEALLSYARKLMTLEAEALRSVHAAPEVRELRIGLPDLFAERYLGQVIEPFAKRFPGVTPLITCEISTVLVDRFNRGQIDLCLTVHHESFTGGEVIGQDEVVWAASREFSAGSGALPLALFPEGCVYRQRALRSLAEAQLDFEVVYVSQSSTAIELAVDRGWAITLRNRRAVGEHWQILGEDEALPNVGTIDFELRTSDVRRSDELAHFSELLRAAVQGDLYGAPPE